MIQFEEYTQILEEAAKKKRTAVFHCMAENRDTVAAIARKIGLNWMTMKRFLVGKYGTDNATIVKIDAYLESQNTDKSGPDKSDELC